MSLVRRGLTVALSLLCDEGYATMDELSWELLIHCYVDKSQNKYSGSQNESKWKFQWRKPRTVAFSQYNRDLYVSMLCKVLLLLFFTLKLQMDEDIVLGRKQCFLTFFGFFHPWHRLLHSHSPRAGFTYRLYRLKPRVSRSKGASRKLWYA